jgi:hypothetical protein
MQYLDDLSGNQRLAQLPNGQSGALAKFDIEVDGSNALFV